MLNRIGTTVIPRSAAAHGSRQVLLSTTTRTAGLATPNHSCRAKDVGRRRVGRSGMGDGAERETDPAEHLLFQSPYKSKLTIPFGAWRLPHLGRRSVSLLRALAARRWARAVANALVGLLLLAAVVRAVPLDALAGHTLPRHLAPVAGILALTVLSAVARAVRWRLLLLPLARVGIPEAFWINAAGGFANYILPLRAGEGVRLWWLSRRQGVALPKALGCLVIDHCFDLGGVAVILSIGAALRLTAAGARLPEMHVLLAALGGVLIMFAGIAAVALLGAPLARLGSRHRLLPAAWAARLRDDANAFRSGAACVGGGSRLALLATSSAVAVTFDGLAFALLFVALGLSVPVLSAVVAQVALLYAYVMPSGPGYVGSLEATGTYLLTSGLGLPLASATGAILLWHALGATAVLALGLLALERLRRRRIVPQLTQLAA
jgi:uncharacterized protein (TIRG00374 family)